MKGVGQVVSFSGAINGFQYNGGQQTPFPTTANGCLITTIEYTFTGISVSYGPVIGTPPTLPGSYTVNAKLIGTGCGGVSSGDFSFIISPKDITGSFTGVNKQYDGNNSATISTPLPGAIVGGETVSLSGGVATFNDASVANGKTVTLTGATITGANAGNYNLLGVSTTTANITKKDITVTVNANQSKVYGSADPTSFFYTLSTPLVNGEVLTGALTRSLGEIVGPYIISQGTLANSNYNITYVGNNFNITKATLTITAEDKLKLYGSTVPSLTYTYTYLINCNVFFPKILEPLSGNKVVPNIIIMPLLAFDPYLSRLGMGGGFFDRTIEFLKKENSQIIAIALAYDFQRHEGMLEAENTDQRLDFVVTEKMIYSAS